MRPAGWCLLMARLLFLRSLAARQLPAFRPRSRLLLVLVVGPWHLATTHEVVAPIDAAGALLFVRPYDARVFQG